MPTYSTANSTSTYTVPSNVERLFLSGQGAEGGDGWDEDNQLVKPGGGGAQGEGYIPVSSGEDYDVIIGEQGGDVDSDQFASGGAAGLSPEHDGGAGGDGDGWGGGGGGAGVCCIRGPAGTLLLIWGGGGGGGGGPTDGTTVSAGGGGGGADGGLGGAGFDAGSPGSDAQGPDDGSGGDGGDALEDNVQPGSIISNGDGVVTNDQGAAAGAASVTVDDSVTAATASLTVASDTQIDIDSSTTVYNEERLRIHRSTSTPVATDGTDEIADVTSLPYSDTGLTQGTEYHYIIESYNTATSTTAFSGEVAATTNAPAPTFDTFDAVDDDGDGTADELDYAWTRGGTDETAYRALFSTDGGSTFSQANGDLSGSATTYTTNERDHGTDHVGKVVAVYPDTTAESGTMSATTEVPTLVTNDISPLDASTEDELGVPQPGRLNTGEYRVEYRETGTSTWQLAGTFAFDDATGLDITGLLDGEKYDVQVRPQTADVTGTYVSVSEVTLLPADTNLTNTDRIA